MTASITTSTRFSRITYAFGLDYPHGFDVLSYETATDPPVSNYISLNDSGALPTTSDADEQVVQTAENLAVLQEIYASDDGFLDADDNAVAIEMRNCPFTNDVAELPKHGFLNPLDADSWDEWIAFLKIRGRFQEGAEITNEGDVHLHFNFDAQPFAPPDGVTEYSLADYWRTYELHGTVNDFFYFSIEVPAGEEYTESNIGEYYPIRALLGVLNENRHATASTNEVNLTPTSQSDIRVALLLASVFDIDQGSGAGDIHFRVNEVENRADGDGHITRINILFQEQSDSPNDYDLEAMQLWLEGQSVEVDTGDDATQTPTFGPFWGLQWIIDSVRRLFPVNDRIIHRGRDNQGSYEIPLEGGTFREVDYDDLDDDPDHTGQKVMASGAHVRVVDFRESANGIIRIPDLPDLVYSPGSGEDYEIHNVSETDDVTCEVRDWGNENIGTLLPKEHLSLRAVLFKNNRGELTNGPAPFIRRYVRQDASISVGADSANYMAISSRYVRAIAFSTSDPAVINEEAFEEGTAQPTNGSNYFTQSSYFIKYAKKVKKPGALTITGHIILEAESTATGTLNGPILDLSHFRGTTETILASKTFGDLSADDDATFDIMAEIEVEEDDVILVSLSYQDDSTMSLSDLKTTTYRQSLKLRQEIDEEFIP